MMPTLPEKDKPGRVQLTEQQTSAPEQKGSVIMNKTHGTGRTHVVSPASQSLSEKIASTFRDFFQEVSEYLRGLGHDLKDFGDKVNAKLDKFAEDIKTAFKYLEDSWGTTSTSHKKALKGFFERLGTAFKNLTGKTVSNQVSHGFTEISKGNFSKGVSQIINGLRQGLERVAQRAGDVLARIKHLIKLNPLY